MKGCCLPFPALQKSRTLAEGKCLYLCHFKRGGLTRGTQDEHNSYRNILVPTTAEAGNLQKTLLPSERGVVVFEIVLLVLKTALWGHW